MLGAVSNDFIRKFKRKGNDNLIPFFYDITIFRVNVYDITIFHCKCSAMILLKFYLKYEIQLTAAQNRAIAEECIMFQYFDYHDIWHFISSLASFFTLLAIAVIDDDIMTSDFDPQLIHIF